jgi:hypothetical protein
MIKGTHYILDNGEIKGVDLDVSIEWSTKNSSIIVQDRLGGVVISTVFLYIDHSFGSKPILFETMVFKHNSFKDKHDMLELEVRRYSTLPKAIIGHKNMIKHLIANRLIYMITDGAYVSQEIERIYTNPHYEDKL